MKTEISMGQSGRLVLPQRVRRQFHLQAGSRIELTVLPDGIFLSVPSAQAHLVEDHGLLIHDGEPDGDLLNAVDHVRADRDAALLGLSA